MNRSAKKLVNEAGSLAERGEEFYRQAAEKLKEAKAADPTLTNAEIGREIGRSREWVSRSLSWSENVSPGSTPFGGRSAEEKGRGAVAVRKMLAEAPLEQVEQIIGDLPRDRQKAIGAAAGHGYLKARTEYEDEERNLTPAQRKEREAAGDALADTARKAVSGFASLGIAGHIEQATEELRELVADASLGKETLGIILRADAAWRHELQVAAAMVGLEVDLQEVR